MDIDIQDLVRKAAGTTVVGDFDATSGLLAPEQSKAFMDLVYEKTALGPLIHREQRRSTSGTIAKIGIGSRILRPRTEAFDDSRVVKPYFGSVPYQTVNSRADTAVSIDVLRRNIEGPAYEEHVVGLVAAQIGRDLEDLHINGDTTDTSADAVFLNQNEGWLRQLIIGNGTDVAHRVDGGAINGGNVSDDLFSEAYEALPPKYDEGSLVWCLSPANIVRYIRYLSKRATPLGDSVLVSGKLEQIAGIPVLKVPKLPNSRILLLDPQNLAAINTYDVFHDQTSEGIQAKRQQIIAHMWFLDDDPVIETQDAIVDVYGLAA